MEKYISNIKTELGYLESQTNEELELRIENLKKRSKIEPRTNNIF